MWWKLLLSRQTPPRTPITSLPSSPLLICLAFSRSSLYCFSISNRPLYSAAPAGVRRLPFCLLRQNSLKPTSSSRAAILRLKAGWDIWIFCAATVKFSVSVAALKHSISKSFIKPPSRQRGLCKLVVRRLFRSARNSQTSLPGGHPRSRNSERRDTPCRSSGRDPPPYR